MLRENTYDFEEFHRRIMSCEEVFEQLFLDFSVNTTEFFRDPEVFSVIREKIIPYLSTFSHIKVWCAGCSNGKEPYSLAILFKEAGLLDRVQIYATDINPYVIDEAKNALFSVNSIEQDINNYRSAKGTKNFIDYCTLKGSYLEINQSIKKNILFFQHSLLENGVLNEFQLILCRNVLIYFDVDLQSKVLQYLHNSLDIRGFLVLGKSGGLLQNRGFELFSKYDETSKIYKKK